MDKKQTKLNSLNADLKASLLIGILAAFFSLIVIKNLDLNISLWKPFLFFVPLTILGIILARLAGQKVFFFYQFGKFGEAGGLNWLVDFGILNFLILVFGISTGIFYSVFKAISFIVAVVNSYFWNKLWVFRQAASQKTADEFTKFIFVSLFGLFINVFLASLIVFMGPQVIFNINTKAWANIAAAFGSLSAMMWNFLGYKFFVFKK